MVYNIVIETCFEIKSLTAIQRPVWREEINSPSPKRMYNKDAVKCRICPCCRD